MGNYISKLNEDPFFFFFEEILKNDLFYVEEKQGMSYACVPNEHIQGPIL